MNHIQAELLRRDNKYWKFGVIYYCRADPRLIVRNRWIAGWAWNFGHPRVWLVLAIVAAMVIAPLFIIPSSGKSSTGVLATIYSVMLVLVIGAAHYIAKGPR